MAEPMTLEEAVEILKDHRESSPGWAVEDAIDTVLAALEERTRERDELRASNEGMRQQQYDLENRLIVREEEADELIKAAERERDEAREGLRLAGNVQLACREAWDKWQTRAGQAEARVAALEAEAIRLRMDAGRLADEVDVLVQRKVIDSRSPAADALLDFREPPRTPRSDRLAALEAALDRIEQRVDALCVPEYRDRALAIIREERARVAPEQPQLDKSATRARCRCGHAKDNHTPNCDLCGSCDEYRAARPGDLSLRELVHHAYNGPDCPACKDRVQKAVDSARFRADVAEGKNILLGRRAEQPAEERARVQPAQLGEEGERD